MKHTEKFWLDWADEIYANIWMGQIGEEKKLANHVHKNYAEFIVRACNCHYELLEACKKALHNIHGYTETPIKIRDQLKQAIAKAEGKE